MPGVVRHGQAPLPPKTRRWGRGKAHGQSDSVESGAGSVSPSKELEASENAAVPAPQEQSPESTPSDPFSPTSPTVLISPATDNVNASTDGAGDGAPLSVEEAVQNVSLH